jgi:hypothetical protein
VLATSNPTTGGYASAYNPVSTPPYQSNISSPGNPADEIPPVNPNAGAPRPNNTPYAPGVVNAPGPAATSPGPRLGVRADHADQLDDGAAEARWRRHHAADHQAPAAAVSNVQFAP